MHSNDLARHARHVLTVGQGRTQRLGPGSDPSIARSWLRCLEDYHLDPLHGMPPVVLEAARLHESREHLQHVLSIAGHEMNSLHRQLAGGHAVLLTDAQGVILNCVAGDADRSMFERSGLWLGADWSERCEGTNGIGTCVVEQQAITIHRDEHFRGQHIGLTCSASPVFDPHGELLAVLDVSSVREDVSRQSQFHTLALVNLSAKVIESGYFLRHYRSQLLLRFHVQADSLGLFSEGLLAFAEDGRILAANQSALNLLGAGRQALVGQTLDAWFDCPLGTLLGRASPEGSAIWALRGHDGRTFHAALRGRACKPVSLPLPVSPPAADLCLVDDGLQRDYRRALRVFERDLPLLLKGETGCGKEAFARAVHLGSHRHARPFVAINCAAIPESLIESELFGYRGGSFTGARKDGMRGKLQSAEGGTLFLDEIGDMPLALQTRLLRVLEERVVVPIGGEPQALDVRIISASHRNLAERVRDGSFREDLLYRLDGLQIQLPAVRERHDVEALLDTLWRLEAGTRALQLDSATRQALLAFDWPGNVRQMRTVLRALVALCDGPTVTVDDLPPNIRQHTSPSSTHETLPLRHAEREALVEALRAQRWHISNTARHLGISRNTLYRKLRQHGVEY